MNFVCVKCLIMNNREYIGKRIAQLRKERGLSQLQLAELTGLKQSNIARIESGKYSTGLDILQKIANIFNVKLDFIE